MSITINTNVTSLVVQKNLNAAQSQLDTSIERMTTGYKINSAKDDAAGLSIATNLATKIRGSEQAQSNIQQAGNLLSTAEGDITNISSQIDRIRELSVQAANGVNSTESMTAIKKEVEARVAEINKIAASSEFNGVSLLNGSGTLASNGLRLQIGSDSEAATNSISITGVFGNAAATAIGLVGSSATFSTVSAAFANSSTAAQFIADCDSALSDLTTRRTLIGAYQNRLDSTFDALDTSIENLSSSKSTIMDTDVASESSTYTKAQILQQAAASLLASANQTPSIALSLI